MAVSLKRRFFERVVSISVFFMLYTVFVPLPNKYACVVMFFWLFTYMFWRRRDGERSLGRHLMFSAMSGFGFYYVYSAVSRSAIFFYGKTFNVDIYSSIVSILPFLTLILVFVWDDLFNEEGRYRRKVYVNLDHRNSDDIAWIEQMKARSKKEMLIAYSKESGAVAENKARLLGLEAYFVGFKSEEEIDKEMLDRETSYQDSLFSIE